MQKLRCFYQVNRSSLLAEESACTHGRMPTRTNAGEENVFGSSQQGCSLSQLSLKRPSQEVQRPAEFHGLAQDIAFKAGGRIHDVGILHRELSIKKKRVGTVP